MTGAVLDDAVYDDSDVDPQACRALWLSVLEMAFSDAQYRGPSEELIRERDKAREWLLGAGPDFHRVCALADYDARWIAERARALAEGDWR